MQVYPSPRNFLDQTPLHQAAENGHIDVCQYIMKNTGDLNSKCRWSKTPLHYAACNGHLEVCKYIMENTKDHNPRTLSGLTPIDLARTKNHPKVVDFMQSYNFEPITEKKDD